MVFFTVWLPTIVVFILMLGLLILFHELGHFFAAKKSGMAVKEFGFGLPPRIFSRKIKGTVYSLNLLPIGGFVKILGEDEESESKESFGNKSVSKRIFVIISGVLMNFVLAYVAFLIVFWASLSPLVTNPEKYNGVTIEGSGGLYIQEVERDGLADKGGLEQKDLIFDIDNIKNPTVIDLRDELEKNKTGSISVKIKRGNDIIEKKIDVEGKSALGVGIMQKMGKVKYIWWKVPYFALIETAKTIYFIAAAVVILLKNLIVSHIVPGEVLGPVGVFGITSVAVQLGFAYVLDLLILFTINLGIINILPFPALDGGRLVFLVVEKIRGRKVAQKVENVIHNIGFLILIILMILVTWRDILRF